MNKKYFEDQIHHFLRQFILPYYEMTGGTIDRSLVDESGVFPCRYNFQNGSPCSYITWGMKNRPVGGRCSET
jgi:hypothetical protein